MLKARLYDFSLFLISLAIAFSFAGLLADTSYFIKALIVYWFFSILYFHLRVFYKNGSTSIEYGITYDLSIVLFAGPLGLFIFELVYRFSVYLYRKWTKTADPTELTDTFYNIGCFVITNSAAFFLYQQFHTSFAGIPFGFWILLLLLVCISSYLSGAFMVIVFILLGELKSRNEATNFIFRNISLLDYGKVAITNGLLFIFLQDKSWEMLFMVFILNYVVSASFQSKSQSIQDKLERDKFEQMAYTDFLTGVHNRTFMDKMLAELNQAEEEIGIVVADIDKFKSINDNYNHAVGDKVIQHFAGTLKSFLRGGDYLFRSGGEEFTLCLRFRNFDQTVELVTDMLKGIENNAVEVEYNGEIQMLSYTASFGLYFYQVNKEFPLEKAYIQADELMLQSKQCGKNRLSALNGGTKKEAVLT